MVKVPTSPLPTSGLSSGHGRKGSWVLMGKKGWNRTESVADVQSHHHWNHSGGGVTPLKCTGADMLGCGSKARLNWKQSLWLLEPALCQSGVSLAACPKQSARGRMRLFKASGEANCNHWAFRNGLLEHHSRNGDGPDETSKEQFHNTPGPWAFYGKKDRTWMGLQDRYQCHPCSLFLLLVRLWFWTISQPTGLCSEMRGAGADAHAFQNTHSSRTMDWGSYHRLESPFCSLCPNPCRYHWKWTARDLKSWEQNTKKIKNYILAVTEMNWAQKDFKEQSKK